ncbi:MAG: threonylcarbamoyl-AMP synthase [Clostridia bacterium]|nr:threonylcarbamoyl-AMP synthase [Clostridia bacterium]MBQ9857244.1 threonylcarbamoyl-AMP synthase [Clostridia bacterium]
MITKMSAPCAASMKEAAQLINQGEVVAFPTETVYGLGADATNEEAVKKIFIAKGRPGDNPLIVHITSVDQIQTVIRGEMPVWAKKLADAYWPGPLTMIFDKGDRIPSCVTAGLDSVAVRIPSHKDARNLIDAAQKPVAAPSANLSGRPSPTTAKHVFDDMNGRIPMIIDGGESDVGLESTVLDVRRMPVKVLRPGGITPKMIADIVGEVEVAGSVMRPLKEGETVLSPGMKYKHYAPEGSLVIVKGNQKKVAEAILNMYDATEGEKCILALEGNLKNYPGKNVFSLGKDPKEMAHRLFDALREMDARGVSAIFSEAVDAEGIGLAVMNRLGRAAAFHIVDAGE